MKILRNPIGSPLLVSQSPLVSPNFLLFLYLGVPPTLNLPFQLRGQVFLSTFPESFQQSAYSPKVPVPQQLYYNRRTQYRDCKCESSNCAKKGN